MKNPNDTTPSRIEESTPIEKKWTPEKLEEMLKNPVLNRISVEINGSPSDMTPTYDTMKKCVKIPYTYKN